MLSVAFAVSILAACVSAQQLSSDCSRALTNVAANPDASACLTPGPLIPLLINSGDTSVIGPINSWLTSLCASQPCSNATLAAIATNVTNGCAADLSSTGFSSSSLPDVISAVQKYYPTVRKVVCLKDNNDLCVNSTLTTIQNSVGTLTISNIEKVVSNGAADVPANISCTDCVKAAYNVVKQDVPGLTSAAAATLQSQCGASFTDGTTPDGIFQSAASASDTQGSGAVPLLFQSSALLVALSSVFAALA